MGLFLAYFLGLAVGLYYGFKWGESYCFRQIEKAVKEFKATCKANENSLSQPSGS